MTDFEKQSASYLAHFNTVLQGYLDESRERIPAPLHEAQSYSLTAGGKRIRPMLVMAVCEMLGGDLEAAGGYALALEMSHTASLIHDDLPAIDNDELRRGRPTCHIAYGEATAIIAADGLFTDAYAVAARNPHVKSAEQGLSAIRILAETVGSGGMLGGEFLDIHAQGQKIPFEELKLLHKMKTAALIRAACQLGAVAAGFSIDDPKTRILAEYGERIGLAFQISDDILDESATASELGKTPGKDAADGKNTYLCFMTRGEAFNECKRLTEGACELIKHEPRSEFLIALAKQLLLRNH